MGKIYVTDISYMLDMWDYEQNIKDPSTVTAKNANSFSWKCKKCGYSRTCSAKSVYLGKGKCPCCDSNKVIRAGVNDVLTRVKSFDKYYDFDNNDDYDIFSAGLDCSDSVNFRCIDCGRKWNATIRSQIRKLADGTYEAKGCPHYNTVKRKKEDVSFIADEPDIMRFFDYEKNKIDAKKTKSNSDQDVALKCAKCGYEWEVKIRTFFRGKRKCKCCELNKVTKSGINDFLTIITEAASSLLAEENPDIDIHNLSIRDKTVVNWHCPVCDKKWSASVGSRVQGRNGAYRLRKCQNCYVNDTERKTVISDVPWVLKFFDTKRNKKKPSEISVHSTKSIFFRCDDCGFAWKAAPKARYEKKEGNCPCCGAGYYIQSGFNDVLTLCPDITRILDESRNPELVLSEEAPNSTREFVFNCHKCGNEWVDKIKNRVKKNSDGVYILRDCPKCSKRNFRDVPYDVEYPDVAKMYDNEANNRPLSSITSYESNTLLLWWRCLACNGQFEARLQAIINSQKTSTKGCPYCSSTKLRKGESFGDIHSELLDEYDPTNELDPYMVFPGCKDVVRWICRKDKTHIWEASFAQRHLGQGNCRICNRTELFQEINSFAAVYSDYVKYWSPSNERNADEVFYNSSEWFKWVCTDCERDYPATIDDFVSGRANCPYCEGRWAIPGVSSLKALYPEIARYYSKKNVTDADHVLPSVVTERFWECDSCGQEFVASVKEIVERPYICPYCEGKWVIPGKTSLAAKHPEIAKHYAVENERDADHVLPSVKTLAHWKCADCGQEFNAYISEMVSGDTDCPYCNGRMAIPEKTSLTALFPDLARQFSAKNGRNPEDVVPYAKTMSIWNCSDCGQEFNALISDMVSGDADCPYCNGRMAIPGKTSLEALYPLIAEQYSDMNERDADHVLPMSSTNAIWECKDCKQIFNANIEDFVNGDADCPYCNGRMAIAGKTSFKALHPDLMKEWDELANYCLGIDADQILDSCRAKVWWNCGNDSKHHYEMSPYERLYYQKRHREACCFCKGRRRKKIFNYA